MRWLLVLFALGCGNPDCPSDPTPAGHCGHSAICQYSDQWCRCDETDGWHCLPYTCTPSDDPAGGPCDVVAHCRYGFEYSCDCVKKVWVCESIVQAYKDLGMPPGSD